MLPPFSVAYVKGWRRSVTCLAVADAIRTLNIDDSVLLPQYKVRFLRAHFGFMDLLQSGLFDFDQSSIIDQPQIACVLMFHTSSRSP